MADPKKVTFYSADPDQHVGMTDEGTGMGEIMIFKNGQFETSNPRFIVKLDRMAATPDIEVKISRKAPK